MDEQPPSIFGTPREWAQDLGLATVIGVFLGVIGPFGSFYGGPIEVRVPYWIGNMWIGFILLAFVARLSIRAAQRFDVPVWSALAFGAALGSAPLCVALSVFSALVWPGNHGRFGHFLPLYGQTLAISEPCSFIYYWLGARREQHPPLISQHPTSPIPAAAVEAPTASPTTGAFLDRLPPRLGRDLIALQMEDHYVRAHTDRGSNLILTPLKDAIAELEGLRGIEGMQVHRSWWVARAAVQTSAPNGRNLVLMLKNGLQAPVSRASVAKLKAAGWITDA